MRMVVELSNGANQRERSNGTNQPRIACPLVLEQKLAGHLS